MPGDRELRCDDRLADGTSSVGSAGRIGASSSVASDGTNPFARRSLRLTAPSSWPSSHGLRGYSCLSRWAYSSARASCLSWRKSVDDLVQGPGVLFLVLA